MTAATRPFPLPQDFNGKRALAPIVRAVIAEARSVFTPERNASRVARQMWPDDKATLQILERAASTMATTSDAQWAGPLAHSTVVQELLTNLGPTSAGLQLLQQGLTLTFDGYNQIKCPGISASASYAGFVGQGGNIPVRQLPVSAGVTLEPRKFGTIVALSREMIESSNAQQLVQAVLVDSVAISLDTALFGSTAGDANRPPGLLNGVSGLTPATGANNDAMRQDLGALAGAVAGLGGLSIAYITDPTSAVKILASAGPRFVFPVLASGGVPAKQIICIALPALASATDPQPRFESSRDAMLTFDDAAPSDLGTPTRSMFQIDSVSIRISMFVSWGLRAPGSISFISGVTW